MTTSNLPSNEIDQEIVALLITLIDSFKGPFVAALASFDLPASQGHLLMCLDEPTPMKALAHDLGFDASHITAIVDGLEQRHLVERSTDPVDRRVKRISITEEGEQVRVQVRSQLTATLPPLANLTAEQRVQLRDLLAVATGAMAGSTGPDRT